MQQLHVSCFFISLQTNTRDIRKSHLFSFSHQALPRKCQPVYVNQAAAGHWSCWTPGRVQHGPLSPTSEITCTSECLFPIPCLPLLACSCHFQSWCFVHSENLLFFFFFNLCILITTSSISKGWMFWDNKIFPQVTLLFLPMDSCIKRKLLISRRKLSWFLYSLSLFSLKPLANLLFIFQGYKTKPNAIRQRSAHILNHEQGLGSLVKSFIRATLKFLTK